MNRVLPEMQLANSIAGLLVSPPSPLNRMITPAEGAIEHFQLVGNGVIATGGAGN